MQPSLKVTDLAKSHWQNFHFRVDRRGGWYWAQPSAVPPGAQPQVCQTVYTCGY